MKKSNKSILSLALVFILLLSTMTMLFASCSKKDEKPESTGDTQQTDAKGNTATKEVVENLPEKDYEGSPFRFYLAISEFKPFFIAEEETGDLLNDAVFKRNKAVEDRFNVDLVFENAGFDSTGGGQGKGSDQIRSLIQANDATYDAYVHVQHGAMPGMILEGYFVNWKDMKYVDLTKPWWFKNVERDLSFGGKVYCMTGDYSGYVSKQDCLLFNKKLCDELNLEYPYQLVNDKKWTWDEFKKMAEATKKDLNGDGAMTVEADRYGMTGWTYEMLPALYVGLGGQPVVKDANNLPKLNINTEKNFTILDKIVELFSVGDIAHNHTDVATYSAYISMFKEDRSMFIDTFLGGVSGYKDMESDFGIIPFPMLDVAQGEYFTRTSNMTGLTYVPVTNADLEKTGIILEALAAESYRQVTPTYFDVILTVKGTRDTESEGMLKIIKDTARFNYDTFLSPGTIISLVSKGQNTFASDYAANEGTYLENLQKITDFYSK